jgi:hypothetical protein
MIVDIGYTVRGAMFHLIGTYALFYWYVSCRERIATTIPYT